MEQSNGVPDKAKQSLALFASDARLKLVLILPI